MRVKSALLFVSLFAFLWVSSLGHSAPSHPSKYEDYFVYNALIEHLFIKNKPNAREFKTLAIASVSVPPEICNGCPSDFSKKLNESIKRRLRIGDGRLDELTERNVRAVSLKDYFWIRGSHILIDVDKIASAVPKGDFWGTRYGKYPDIQGIIRLSRVSYDPDGNSALVYLSSTSGPTWGVGYLAVMEKKSGVWKVKETAVCWAS